MCLFLDIGEKREHDLLFDPISCSPVQSDEKWPSVLFPRGRDQERAARSGDREVEGGRGGVRQH